MLFGLLLPSADRVALAAQGRALELAAHRAFYSIALHDVRSGSSVTDAQGFMEFQWEDHCDGWEVSQVARLRVYHGDAGAVEFGWNLSSWEAKDGLSYKIYLRRFQPGSEVEEIRARASFAEAGGVGEAVYEQPQEQRVELPPGTLFPTAHSLAMIEAAEQGRLPLWRMVYDGTGEQGLFGVSVAQAGMVGAERSEGFALLQDQASWPMHLAFFDAGTSSMIPDYEQSLRLYRNGIVDDLLLDYGDFTMKATLESLEPVAAPEC